MIKINCLSPLSSARRFLALTTINLLLKLRVGRSPKQKSTCSAHNEKFRLETFRYDGAPKDNLFLSSIFAAGGTVSSFQLL